MEDVLMFLIVQPVLGGLLIVAIVFMLKANYRVWFN